MKLKVDDLRSPEVHKLLQEHLHAMTLHSPPESIHALDIEALRQPDIAFWTAWDDAGALLGCGALKTLAPLHGEVKSMRTAQAYLRRGVARALLDHIVAVARARGQCRLSLETGSATAFEPARRLYLAAGFEYCQPFAQYIEDPHSVFMTRSL
jgi:putative acetyltransferase